MAGRLAGTFLLFYAHNKPFGNTNSLVGLKCFP